MEKINKILVGLIGISLILLLAIETNFFSDFRASYMAYLSDVVMALLIGAIVAILLKKYILKEQERKQLNLLKISQNVHKSGFKEFYSSFDEVNLKQLMRGSKNVEIYVTYADRVLGNLSKIIKEKLSDETFRLEIFISDKENPFLKSYADLWKKDSPIFNLEGLKSNIDDVISEIRRTKKNLEDENLYKNNLKLYSVKYHPVFFSFYRFDDELIFVPSKLIETKNVPIPTFKFEKTLNKQDMFNWVYSQLQFIKTANNFAIEEIKL